MKHHLSLKAAAVYGHLIDTFAPVYMRDDFRKRFEEFLDAYDGDSKPDKTQTVENFQREVAEQRKIPKVGEIYKDDFGSSRFEILAVLADSVVVTKSITKRPQNEIMQIGTLENFQRLNLTKED